MKKNFLISLLLISLCFSLHAGGEQEKHEFTLGGTFGWSVLKMKMDLFKPMGGISAGYNYFFNDITGVSTGIGWSLYNWRLPQDPFSDSYLSNDGEEPFEFRSSFTGYEESYRASFLVIPLAIRFQYPLFSDDNLTYFSFGGKVGFPLGSKFSASGANFTTSGYYPAYDVLLETPESRGFGTFSTGGQKSNLTLRTMWALSAEAGMKWDISAQYSLYAGLSVDYSLNSIGKEKGKSFLIYNPQSPTDWTFNSLMNSKYTQDGKTENFVNRANPFTVGIVIRIAFKLPE
ncbi:MAG: PorT family protein [Tannerella sp.]|jgi:hypothetical protein|nr:PorT family protein [Tannerella sp.]